MKKGFTLVEIVITVMIISIVGMGLLQTHSNSMKTLELINSRMEVNKFSTFIFSNISKNLHQKQRTVYEFIKDRYQINDDDIIDYLKSATYLYTQNELFFLNFGENADEEDDSLFQQSSNQESNKEVSDEVKREGVLVEKISIKDENNNSTSLYHFSYLQNDKNNKSIKGILTGPCTIASSVRVENYYSDNKDENLIYDLANALKKEAEAIQDYVSIIQIDEPILSTGMYELDTARRAIKRITENLKVPVAMHVCGNVVNIFDELNTFNVDILDHEFASNRKNLDILESIDKKVGFGCINTKLKTVESVDEIKDLINEGFEILKNNKSFMEINGNMAVKLNNYMIIDPDCGMRLLPLDVAQGKLKNMVIASDEFERELTYG